MSQGLFYAGVWASNVSFGGKTDIEFDIYAGVTPEWSNAAFDFGFSRYLYPDDKTNYGETFAKVDWLVSDQLMLGLDYYREVYANQDWPYANAKVSELPWDFTLSGGVGSDLGSRNLSKDKYTFDVGVSRDFNDHSSIDLRFYGSNLDEERVIF